MERQWWLPPLQQQSVPHEHSMAVQCPRVKMGQGKAGKGVGSTGLAREQAGPRRAVAMAEVSGKGGKPNTTLGISHAAGLRCYMRAGLCLDFFPARRRVTLPPQTPSLLFTGGPK